MHPNPITQFKDDLSTALVGFGLDIAHFSFLYVVVHFDGVSSPSQPSFDHPNLSSHQLAKAANPKELVD
jgi:hypothetical protein